MAGIALVAGTLAACGSSGSSTPAAAFDADGALLPDLATLAPTDFRVVEEDGARLLRFEVEFVNLGAGPIEMEPTSASCPATGDADEGRVVNQRVYVDADGDATFDPTLDVELRVRESGCVRFHDGHDHWHLDQMADYRLFDGRDMVASHQKVSACLLDVREVESLPGGPEDLVYGDCDQDSVQGLSIGWGDPYYAELDDQFIDVTGVPDGTYCVEVLTDPEGRIAELSRENNQASAIVTLSGDTVTSAGPCDATAGAATTGTAATGEGAG